MTIYAVQIYKQVLYAGEWNAPDCEWDWESEELYFDNETDAKKSFRTVELSADEPMVRLNELTLEFEDGRWFEVDRNVIDERWVGE